jgi:hypothetical protein
LEMQLERGLGNIQAGIDGSEVLVHNCECVLTHSCGYELAGLLRRSGNGSSSGHKSADGSSWATDSVVQGQDDLVGAAAVPPAGGTAAPSSCLAKSQTRKMKRTYKG